MIPARDYQHAQEAVALLTDAFRNQVNIPALVKSFCGPVQDFENAIWDVINKRLLDNAANAQLDTLGKVVGEPRLGRLDPEYRYAIRLRIRVNRSQGKAEDVLQVAALAAYPNPVQYYDGSRPAAFSLVTLQLNAVASVLRLLGATKAGGTRGVLAFSPGGVGWDDTQDFVYGSKVGTVANAKTYGDKVSGTLGAIYLSGQRMAE